MNAVKNNPLGKQIDYVSHYSPQLLFPIARELSRQLLPPLPVPFYGEDVWTAYEVSWLDEKGKPQVAVAEFYVPYESEFIIESKSLKLYLNSINQTQYPSRDHVARILHQDLSAVAGIEVGIQLFTLAEFRRREASIFNGDSLDELPLAIENYHPAPQLLTVGGEYCEESLCSDLLKTNCPVTGQPDWASVQVNYRGKKIQREGLLGYLVSFREHQDFHEHCVERLFSEILLHCKPEYLSINARYTRRGGLDINPYRTTDPVEKAPALRLVRQ